MTLREFTKKYVSLDTETGQKAMWRKAFPSDIRYHNKQVGSSFWSGYIYKEVLEEKWVRFHKGDVIDVEWREIVYVDDDVNWN